LKLKFVPFITLSASINIQPTLNLLTIQHHTLKKKTEIGRKQIECSTDKSIEFLSEHLKFVAESHLD